MRAPMSSVAPLALLLATACSASSPAAPTGSDGGPDAPSHPVDSMADVPKGMPDGSADARFEADAVVADGSSEAATEAGGEAGTGGEAGADASSDAPAPDPVSLLGSCKGTATAMTVSSQMPYVSVAVGSQTGEFVLDFGTNFSSIDLSAFTAPGPSTSGCNAATLGATCTVAGVAFFSASASVTLTTASFSGIIGTVRQAGLAGTDLLGQHVFVLDYAAGEVYATAAACPDATLTAAGFVPLTTAGFFENDVTLLEAATKVDSNAAANLTVADVPTVPVTLAGVSGLAQLDTGFDDSVTPFSVNVNQAMYDAIAAANPTALARDTTLDETLTTCVVGVSEPVTGYRLAAGATFDFVPTTGGVARSYAKAAIYVKHTPAAAQVCGGVGAWTVPAAQVGASFYVDMKAVVFDPFAAKVWMPKG